MFGGIVDVDHGRVRQHAPLLPVAGDAGGHRLRVNKEREGDRLGHTGAVERLAQEGEGQERPPPLVCGRVFGFDDANDLKAEAAVGRLHPVADLQIIKCHVAAFGMAEIDARSSL